MTRGSVPARDLQAFLANALIAIGALIALLCGGCTLVVATLMALAGAPSLLKGDLTADGGGYAALVAIGIGVIGVLPTLLGVGLLVLGRWLKRRGAGGGEP